MSLGFEWDEEKAKSNFERHGITFAEAATVFGDPLSISISDAYHYSEQAVAARDAKIRSP